MNSKEPLAQAQQDGNVDIISHKTLSAGRIAEEINERMGVDKKTISQRKSTKIPEKAVALFESLIPLLPNRYHSSTNNI